MPSTDHSVTRRAKSYSNALPSAKSRILSMPRSFPVLTDRRLIQMAVIMPDMHSFICVYLLLNGLCTVCD